MSSEADVQKRILEYLRLRGFKVWRQNSGRGQNNIRLAPKGTSDIIGCLPGGRFIALEVKAPTGGRVSPAQRSFIDSITELGGLAGVVRSVADVIALLGDIPA